MTSGTAPPTARLATAADAPEVVRLACVMFRAMGMPDPGDPWRDAAVAHFSARVGDDAIGAVVEHPSVPGRAVASGAVTISTRLPTPPNPTGAYAYIQWIATDDEFRGRGYARAVMAALLAALDGRDIPAVELHATPMGEPLYRTLGFWEGTGAPPLRRRRWDPPPVGMSGE
jgi:GNAT superfamily N-acetyltransferase